MRFTKSALLMTDALPTSLCQAWHIMQEKKGRQAVVKAKREARLAVLGQAQVVGCTLSAAGGELASLLGNALHFDGLIIDEVGCCLPRPCMCQSS